MIKNDEYSFSLWNRFCWKMRNLFISKEIRVSDLAPRNDAVAITANPFAKEVFVLYESGLLIGVQESSCEV